MSLLPPWPAHRLVISPPALFEGKSLAAIAREEGVSRHTIAKQAKSDDVRQIVVAVVNDELERICQVFARMLRVIEEAFAARVIRADRRGGAIDLGPDHYARLAAVGGSDQRHNRVAPQAEGAGAEQGR